jgi:hypothetical protein
MDIGRFSLAIFIILLSKVSSVHAFEKNFFIHLGGTGKTTPNNLFPFNDIAPFLELLDSFQGFKLDHFFCVGVLGPVLDFIHVGLMHYFLVRICFFLKCQLYYHN